jgi:aldehyde:ferredoxin oxidoreductase
MKAVSGRYLYVDLTTEAIRDYPIRPDWMTRFVGGKGIAARLLLEELPERVHALGPENMLAFATGPFQGTGLVGSGRHAVLGVSPKTGFVADSYVGGYFGHELGRSGYDGIVVRGRSASPVYLALIDGQAELLSAHDLWGRGTGETEEELKRRHPNARVSSIGVAGENLVSQACIINDRSRAAGRPGLGAVMGSKNLKAIVVRGCVDAPLADPDRFASERTEYVREYTDERTQEFGKYGTSWGLTTLSERGMLPTENFREGVFDGAESIGGVAMHDTILTERETCAGCPVRCKRRVRTSFAGRDVLPEYGGPEYETLAALGSLCLNSNLHSIALANQLCNDHGLDTISTGVAIAFLMEASERGLIDEKVVWGNPDAVVDLTQRIARREGIGDHIADGLEPFARKIGADFAMTIKGVELPMHDPRGKQGLGISYATTPRGANHMEGAHDTMLARESPCPELGVTRSYDRFTLADKPAVAKTFEDLRSFTNCLVLCCFTTREVGERYSFPAIRSLLNAATGLEVDVDEMLTIGERAYALMRTLSARAGHRIDDDNLPARLSTPLPRGASAGHPIVPEEMEAAIRAYYEARGFDPHGPTDATLRRLGMADCVGRAPRETV